MNIIAWTHDCIQVHCAYSELSKRIESFGEFCYASDFAEMGAYNDDWYYGESNRYKCYSCAFAFNVDDIVRFSRREKIGLSAAGIIKHITANPCCGFLHKLSSGYRIWILSKLSYSLLFPFFPIYAILHITINIFYPSSLKLAISFQTITTLGG